MGSLRVMALGAALAVAAGCGEEALPEPDGGGFDHPDQDGGVRDRDNEPPETELLSAGPPVSSLPYATFTFTSNEPATFECSLDGEPFQPCSSPHSYPEVSYGPHIFRVRAVDLEGAVDPTPAEFSWNPQPHFYRKLSDTGLFTDVATRELGPGVMEFSPNFELWSDGAVKTRWIRLPPGATIDTSDFDRWRFPVGTQIWKEFRSPDGQLIETRLIERRSAGGTQLAENYLWAASFIWRLDGSDADFTSDGRQNVNGTTFDVPAVGACRICHQGQPGFVLGFSAIQLARPSAKPGDITLARLDAAGLLSDRPRGVELASIGIPGNAVARSALGSLHANCGHCHNPRGNAAPIVSDLDLMARVNETTVETASAYVTTVGRTVSRSWNPPASVIQRIQAGSAVTSGIYFRASVARGDTRQMPPRAFNEVLPPLSVLSDLASWIDSL